MKYSFFLSLFLFSMTGSWAQKSWLKKFNGLNIYNQPQLASFASGGFVTISEIEIFGPVVTPGLAIMRYDECEKINWSKQYVSPGYDFFVNDISTTKDDGILITGPSHDISSNFYVVKIDASGQVVFNKHFDWNEALYVYTIRELYSGGYFVYGNTYMSSGAESRNFVMKLSEDGAIVWTKTYFSIPIWGRAEATRDGGIITRTGDHIFKLRDDGSLQWAKQLSGLGYYESVPLELNDGYVFARYPNYNLTDTNAYVFKLDLNGNLLWTSDVFQSYNIKDIALLNNGEFVLAGHIYVDTLANPQEFSALTIVDKNGTLIQQKVMSLPSEPVRKVTDMIVINGRDILFTGRDEIAAQPSEQHFLSKTNSALTVGDCNGWYVDVKRPKKTMTLTDKSVVPQEILLSIIDRIVITTSLDPLETLICEENYPASIYLGKDTLICENEGVRLSAGSYPFDSYLWSTGDTTVEITVNTPGIYWLKTSVGCEELSDTIEVHTHEQPVPQYTIQPTKATPLVAVYFNSLTPFVTNVCWEVQEAGIFCETSFSHYFNKNGVYNVIYSYVDTNDCRFRDESGVTVSFYSLYLPNTFSPNNDEVNEEFKPEGFGIISFHLRIYTRWGDLLFEGTDEAWNGMDHGRKLSSDTYVYRVNVTQDNGEKIERTGTVLVL